jgi:hypothetical protein
VRRWIALSLSLLLVTAGAAASEFERGAARAAPFVPRAQPIPLRLLVGQSIMTAFNGFTIDRALLRRIRLGEIGGLIVFGGNYRSDRQLRQAIAQAQAAARAGYHPPSREARAQRAVRAEVQATEMQGLRPSLGAPRELLPLRRTDEDEVEAGGGGGSRPPRPRDRRRALGVGQPDDSAFALSAAVATSRG